MNKHPWQIVEYKRTRLATAANAAHAEDVTIPSAEYDPTMATLTTIAAALRLATNEADWLGPRVSEILHQGAIRMLRAHLKETTMT